MLNKTSRFTGYDILKFVCAFFIVCIHTPFPGVAGEYYTAFTRIAVPIFFMITVFFFSDVIRRGKCAAQIKKLLRLVIEANLLYLMWNCFYTSIASKNVLEYLQETLTIGNIAKFLILNESPFGGHLWYLGAAVYVLLITMAVETCGGDWKEVLYLSTPLLLIGDLLLGKYSILLWGREFSYILVRNWIFVGLPYFSVGMLLREKKEVTDRIPAWVLAALSLLFSLTAVCERFILVSLNANATRDHYISTTFLAVTVFLLFKSFDRNRTPGRIETWMASVGRKHSSWVYIVHPIFITAFAVVMRKIGLFEIYQYIAPFAIYGVSIAFVAIMNKLFIHCKSKVTAEMPK